MLPVMPFWVKIADTTRGAESLGKKWEGMAQGL